MFSFLIKNSLIYFQQWLTYSSADILLYDVELTHPLQWLGLSIIIIGEEIESNKTMFC